LSLGSFVRIWPPLSVAYVPYLIYEFHPRIAGWICCILDSGRTCEAKLQMAECV